MALEIAVFCIIMAMIGQATENKMINPLTIFFALWAIIFYLYSLKLYGLNEASNETLQLMQGGLVAFGVGYYIVRLLNIDKFRFSFSSKGKAYIETDCLRQNVLYGIIIFCAGCMAVEAIPNIKYLFSAGGLNYIRKSAQDSTAMASGLFPALKNLIINPFILALQPMVACDFWLGKRNKRLLAADILILFVKTVADGSRISFIFFAIHFLVAYLFSVKNERNFMSSKKRRRNRWLIFWMGGIALSALVITTLSRSGTKATTDTYYYFSMQPYMFEYWSSRVTGAHLIGYGLASTHGFSFAILYILHNLGIGDYPAFWHSISTMINNTLTDWVAITSSNTLANAYVSLFWYFYLDGREFGVIVGSLIYGAISAYTYRRAVKKPSLKRVCIYSFLLQSILMTFVRFQFADMNYAIAFIMIFLFIGKKG